MKGQENPCSIIINFVDLWGKKVILLYKKIEKMHVPSNNLLMTNELVKRPTNLVFKT
jgi:hypothetical protein